MIKTTLINSTVAQYDDKDLSFTQDKLLTAGYLENTDGTQGFKIEPTSPTSRSILVKKGSALVDFTKAGRTFKVVVESDSDVTLPSSATPISGKADYVIIKLDKVSDPNIAKNNIGTLELVRLNFGTTTPDADIQAILGANYTFLRLGYVNVGAVTNFTAGDIANQAPKSKLNNAVAISNTSIVYPAGTFAGATRPTSPYTGQIFLNTSVTPPLLEYWDGTSWANAVTYTPANGVLAAETSGTATPLPVCLSANANNLVKLDFKANSGQLSPTGTQVYNFADVVANQPNRIAVFFLAQQQCNILSVSYSGGALISLGSGVYICKNPTIGNQTFTATIQDATSGFGFRSFVMFRRAYYNVDQAQTFAFGTSITALGQTFVSFAQEFQTSTASGQTGPITLNSQSGHSNNQEIVNVGNFGNQSRYGYMVLGDSGALENSSGNISVTRNETWGGIFNNQVHNYVFTTIKINPATPAVVGVMQANSASVNGFNRNRVLGFTATPLTINTSTNIITDGVVSGFTGLEVGQIYYLNDAGGVSKVAGTIPIKVGVALSATKLLLKITI